MTDFVCLFCSVRQSAHEPLICPDCGNTMILDPLYATKKRQIAGLPREGAFCISGGVQVDEDWRDGLKDLQDSRSAWEDAN